MEIKGKRVIIIGERDGIPGPAIEAVIKSVGGEPILVQTQCFVWTSAGTLDPEGQEEIRSLVDKYDPEEMIVLLGSPTVESTEIFARTVTEGDPTWVGPLAGTSLKLPVYHILEPSIKEQIKSKNVWDIQLYEYLLRLM